MKKLLIISLFFSVTCGAQHVTFIWHSDTLWAMNPSTRDSVMISPRPIAWASVISKPATYTSVAHTHPYSEITSKPTLQGYSINVQALTSSPADGQTIYFGMLPKAPVTAAATSKIYIRKAGTIKIAEIYCYSGTAGTNEAWVLSVRLNNTTDTQIASVSAATSERIFTNSSLNISVAAGDYIEIKGVQPTWATNPLTTIYGGYIYIE